MEEIVFQTLLFVVNHYSEVGLVYSSGLQDLTESCHQENLQAFFGTYLLFTV